MSNLMFHNCDNPDTYPVSSAIYKISTHYRGAIPEIYNIRKKSISQLLVLKVDLV